MFPNCSAVQYGIPVLHEVGHLQDFFASCCHSFMSHIVDGHGVCREYQTSPSASDLASPVCMYKRDATPHLPASTSHVVLLVTVVTGSVLSAILCHSCYQVQD